MEHKQRWFLVGGVIALILAGGIWMTRSISGSEFGLGYRWGPGMSGGMMGRNAGWMGAMHGGMWGTAGREQIPEAPALPDAPRQKVTINIREWEIQPTELQVEGGKRLVLTVRNDGTVPHNFAIPDLGVRLVNIPPGTGRTVELNTGQPGSYQFLCDIPGHAQLGQTGTLTVTKT